MSLSLKQDNVSYKSKLIASILLLLTAFYTLNAGAIENYAVDNVIIDSDGKDENEAKTKAMAQGEIDAFRQLATRLSPAKAQDIITKTTSSEISRLIRGFEVLEEKITPEHYHASMRYTFNVPLVHQLFPDAIDQQENKEQKIIKAVLIIPVSQENGALKLWQDDNKWRTIWYESALVSGGGLVVAPLGDLDDRVDIDDTNVEASTAKTLARMYVRYGVSEIYIATAFFNKKADPKPTLEVTLRHLQPEKDDISRRDFTIHSTENLDMLMARASDDIAKSLYRLQTINPNKIEFDRLKEINARVNTSDIVEWQSLRKRLLAHGNIVGIRFNAISFYETSMTISFKGTPDLLGKTLVASGLRVLQDGDSLVLLLK